MRVYIAKPWRVYSGGCSNLAKVSSQWDSDRTGMSIRSAAKSVLPVAVANRIREVVTYCWTLRRFQPYRVRRSWAGYPFELWIPDPTAQSWYDHDSPATPPEMSFLAQHRLRQGATVFDCGAHQCVIAMIMAKFVGATGSSR